MIEFGITESDFEYLLTDEARDIIDREIDNDSSQLALRGIKPLLCSQIKYLNRCKNKLPHLYEVRGVIPPLSYEQASSYHTAASRGYSGKRLLDLTCGLGVDAYYNSKRFDTVIALEQVQLLAKIAVENFKRLGVNNVEVVNTSAEEFISNYRGDKFDVVYIDPARRDNSKKVFLLEECSPNVVELLPKLIDIADKIVIKLSPLFDRTEAERIFGSNVSLRALSVGGECKEMVVELGGASGAISCDIIERSCRVVSVILQNSDLAKRAIRNPNSSYNYIYLPDVTLRKMRCVEPYFATYHNEDEYHFCSEMALSNKLFSSFAGKVYAINKMIPYKPKLFRAEGVKEATLIIYNFDYSADTICKTLKIKNRGSKTLIFTNIDGNPMILFVKPLI